MRKVYTALKGDKNGSYVRIEAKTLEMVKYLACFAGDDLFGEDILFYTKGEFREFYKEPDDIQKIFLMMVFNFLIILFTFLLSYTGLLAYQGKKKARLAFNVGMAWAIVQGGRLFFVLMSGPLAIAMVATISWLEGFLYIGSILTFVGASKTCIKGEELSSLDE